MLKLRSPLGLSPTGVGPALLLMQLPLLAAALIARQRWPASTLLPFEPSVVWRSIGGAWLCAGIALWALTLRCFLREFPRGRLIVDGPYRLCRHPLYASLFVFVLPGIALLLHTWTVLVAALLGDVFSWVLVEREELELDRTFGDEWRVYRSRTSRLFPFPASGRVSRSVAAALWTAAASFCVYVALALPLMAAK